jgi:acylphosphatase
MHSVKGTVRGRVQGVGFRYFVSCCAEVHGVCGYARNLADGRVEFLLQGEVAAIDKIVDEIRRGPRHARVDEVNLDLPEDHQPCAGFSTR